MPARTQKAFSSLTASSLTAWGLTASILLMPITARCSFAAPASPSLVDFEHAQTLYAAGDAADSLKYLDAFLRVNPNDASAHYLKANCFVLLKRLPESVTEYATVERLLPKSKLAAYAQMARTRINAMPVTRGEARALSSKRAPDSDSETTDDDDDENVAPDQAKNSSVSTSLPANTIETIRKQAAQARARQAEIGRAEAEGEIEKANNQVKSMQERVAREGAHGRNGTEPTTMSAEQSEAVRGQTSQTAERLRQQGQWKAEIKQWEAQEKVNELKEQAENLEWRLLHEPVGPISDVRLNPIGTNLYTRNYASVPSRLVPMHAQVKSLPSTSGALLETSGSVRQSPATSSSQQTNAQLNLRAGSAKGKGIGAQHAVTTVKGQVVRP